MKYFKYILRNALRNKLRSTLTVLSVSVSLAMMTVLYGYLEMQKMWAKESKKYNRVVIMNIQGFSGRLPIAYLDRVRAMPGVKAAVPFSWFGGLYKEERTMFAQFGTDPEHLFDVWDEYQIDPEQLREWKKTPNGCVVDRKLAKEKGWKVGDRIPLKGTFYEFNLDLTLCGLFDAPELTNTVFFNWKYLDEGLKQKGSRGSGNSGIIYVKAESADVIPSLSKAIDDNYASSESPTKTQTEEAFAQLFAAMIGNVQRLIRVIGAVVVIALALVTANAMAMSMRERTTEIAVLKAIGFQRGLVLALVLGESVIIATVGGLLGVAAGRGVFATMHRMLPQVIPIDRLAGAVIVYALVTAAVIGLVSGLFPAYRAAQLSVIDGLRRVV